MAPRILFLTLLNDVGSDRIVSAMGRRGCECIVMGSRDSFAAHSRYVTAIVPLPRLGGLWLRSVGLGARLRRVVRERRPDLVIPLDDVSARTLRAPRFYQAASSEVRRLLRRSFGAPSGYAAICSRDRQIEVAAALGIRTPRQQTVATLADAKRVAAEFGYPVVLKREQTCGGFGVAVVADEAQLGPTFRSARGKARFKHAMQRLLRLPTAGSSPLVMQAHVAGPMAFRVAACLEGEVLDAFSLAAECVNPPVTGASTVVAAIDEPAMATATRELVAALGCSGLVSLDFILAADGVTLIEINARPVASGHLGALYGHDVHRALIDAVAGLPVRAADDLAPGPDRVALFPRELDRDPSIASLAAGASAPMHDVPLDEPDVMPLYLRWLERRHPAHASGLRRLLLGSAEGTRAAVDPRRARAPAMVALSKNGMAAKS